MCVCVCVHRNRDTIYCISLTHTHTDDYHFPVLRCPPPNEPGVVSGLCRSAEVETVQG